MRRSSKAKQAPNRSSEGVKLDRSRHAPRPYLAVDTKHSEETALFRDRRANQPALLAIACMCSILSLGVRFRPMQIRMEPGAV